MAEPRYRVPILASVALLRKNDQTSSYAGQVRKELEVPDLPDSKRSHLLLCLGRLHENGRDYESTFLNFCRSRKLRRSKFKLDCFLPLVGDASSVMPREVLEIFKAFGHESEKPIFVVGIPRSGTTMTEQIIAAHTEAEGVGELKRIELMAGTSQVPVGCSRTWTR